MRASLIVLISLSFLCTAAGAWEFPVVFRDGGSVTITLGQSANATRGFDKGVDQPAPPPMPVGFYASIPLQDSVFNYIPWLWKDMRPESAQPETWKVVVFRSEGPGHLEYALQDLPPGMILVNDRYDLAVDTSAVTTFNTNDTVKMTYYPPAAKDAWFKSRLATPKAKAVKTGGKEENGLEYKVQTNDSAKVTIEVLDKMDKLLAQGFKGTRTAGTYFWVWDGKDAQGKSHPAGRYRYHLKIGSKEEWGSFVK